MFTSNANFQHTAGLIQEVDPSAQITMAQSMPIIRHAIVQWDTSAPSQCEQAVQPEGWQGTAAAATDLAGIGWLASTSKAGRPCQHAQLLPVHITSTATPECPHAIWLRSSWSDRVVNAMAWNNTKKFWSKWYSRSGTRTLVSCVKGKYADHLHQSGIDISQPFH